MSDTKVELIEDCVMLFLGFVGILVGMVDDFGTPRFNAGGGEVGGWEERGEEGEGRKDEGGKKGTKEKK